jgi:RHH-type proline utilization regulon transcriptional repressor/proline dehydrogenase/delta 1-pyrroline-5-carboxylate dehydrogenase
VISFAAREKILAHIDAMRARGYPVFAPEIEQAEAQGIFVAPTVIEIPGIDVLGAEVFGPVLHVLRYKRAELERAVEAVNALGYGLTFGIHSRIEETIQAVSQRIRAGNIYVNRNIIGAVVGVQPFGGHGLSGTGPKAGGPLYLRRLLAERPAHGLPVGTPPEAFEAFINFLQAQKIATDFAAYGGLTPLGAPLLLPGPVGEQNQYWLRPRGNVLCRAATQEAALRQIAASLATGNIALVWCDVALPALQNLPASLARHIRIVAESAVADVALFDGDAVALRDFMGVMASQTHALVAVHTLARDGGRAGDYPLEFLVAEQSVSVNTAAAGGNASLMTIG